MNRTLYIISIICCLTGCAHNCPDFNDDILTWIPYKTNDTISFKKNNQTVQFIITKTFLDHTTSYKGKCGCENYYGFESGDATRHINFTSYNDQTTDEFYIDIKDGNNYGSSFTDKKQLSSITIDSTTFENVLVLTGDSLSTTDNIWKVIFAKDKGIVAIYYRDSVMTGDKICNKTTSQGYYNLHETKCD